MEVVSPAFFSSPKALNEVNLVCETLPRKYRLATNTSCSVHVHVGNGDRGFTLEHLQNMMALFWVFEGQLDSIHPYHRVKGTKTYSGALRFDTVLAYNLRGNKNAARDGISRIFATQNINDIIRLFDVSHVSQSRVRKSRYNIGNLEEYEPARFNAYLVQRTKKTTEFRHHEATFDVEAVNQWVRMCVHLVEFAEEIKRDKLGAWLEQHANTEYSVIQILEATKQPLAAFYYERKLAAKAALGLDTLEPES
ncbi:hypothetical protein LZ554_005231 [Drepanopeziza brunnea f. sp. 'monogermtubi']|nr:hypothetical protein LZ554_005231 [Drepanopeziza brunnea f. sp. 'monogermtubi']